MTARHEAEQLEDVKDSADEAETFPGSGVLNWGEVPFKSLAAWVERSPQQVTAPTGDFDVESVKGMFEAWWREQHVATAPQPEQKVCGWSKDPYSRWVVGCAGYVSVLNAPSLCPFCGLPIREVRP